MNKISEFVKREFELNQRQARIFIILCSILIVLIGLELFPFERNSEPVKYQITYAQESVAQTNNPVRFDSITDMVSHGSKDYEIESVEIYKIGDINELSSTQLIVVKGIGEVLSNRIVKFRDALGGFHSKSQLYEVYGLDSSVALSLMERVDLKHEWDKLDVNLSSFKEINHHPYISYEQTKQIMNLRRTKIFLESEDLKVILNSGYEKMAPYLAY